jgi:tetratricopeptide (TPR) repeat protein
MANNTKEFGKVAQRLSRNPLGIIALFIVMIYTMAALLVGLSKLDPGSQKIFVWFLVTFPVLVLIVFYVLVTKHSGKLYAPQDFSDETNFIRMIEAAGLEKSPRFTSFIKELSVNAEKELNNFRIELEKTKLASLTDKPPKEVEEKLDDFSRRLEFFEALRIPLKPEDYINRGNDFYYKDEYEFALYSYEKAIELKPDDAEAWYNKGVALSDLERHEEALTAYEKTIELKPENHDAWYNKACAYSLKGDKENTLKNLSKAIELDAGNKEKAKKDEDFKNFWDDPDFKEITS